MNGLMIVLWIAFVFVWVGYALYIILRTRDYLTLFLKEVEKRNKKR